MLRTTVTLLCSIFLLNLNLTAQEFTSQNSGTSQYLRSISMVSETTGYLSANGGVIRKTTNSGQTWEAVNSPTSSTLWGIYFLDENTGWVVGDGGYIGRTTDGGNTWTSQNKAASDGGFERLTDVHFIDANNGFTVGSNGLILKSTDGGLNWTESQFFNDGGYFFRDVHMYSSSRIIVGGTNSRIYLSTNGGSSWSEVNSGGEEVNAFSIVGSLGFAVGDGGLMLVTANSGSSWSNLNTPTNEELRGVYFYDTDNGFIVGDNGTIYQTNNTGSSWSVLESGTTSTLYTMGGSAGSIWIGGLSGLLLSNVVLPPSIDITYPNGGEAITERTDVNIEWSSTNLDGNVTIELFRNNSLELNIATVAGSDGSYTWTVPESISEDSSYTIKITSINDGSVSDESDESFTIEPQRNEVFVSVDPIEGGEVLGAGVFIYGETVQLTAEPADSYLFVNWTSNEIEVGTEEVFEFIIESDTSLTANFEFDPTPPTITVRFPEVIEDTIGAIVDIPMTLDFNKATDFESFEFQLGYNPTMISINDISLDGSLIAGFDTLGNSPQSGILNFTGASSDIVSEEGLFFTLNTTFLDTGVTDLTWNNFYFNEGEPLASPVDGVIIINGIPRKCGDVTDDGFVTNEDATWILRHGVKLSPQFPFVGEDSLAADVTANGWISAYDAAQVLKDVVNLPRNFNCEEPLTNKIDPLLAQWNWSPKESDGRVTIPLDFEVTNGKLESIDIEVTVPTGYRFEGIIGLDDSWVHAANQIDNTLLISMYGFTEAESIRVGEIILQGSGNSSLLKARAHLNEQITAEYQMSGSVDRPTQIQLFQNYPNPFNPSTTISYAIPDEGLVQLTIYNALGQQVAELVNEVKQSGTYSAVWDASNQASGIYVYKITYGNTVLSKKLMLIK